MTIRNGHQGSCLLCLTAFQKSKPWQKFCTTKCQYTFSNKKRKADVTNFGSCARCGKSLAERKSHAIYCSKTCKSMDHTFKHRAKTRFTSTARRNQIYNRDEQKCYICQSYVEQKAFELDHLVPISRGGDSASENLAVTCMKCNRSKGDKIGVEQLAKLLELRS